VLDLWRARPPTAAAAVRNDGCLALDAFAATEGSVRAQGRALRQLFENSLVVEVRNAIGRSVGSRPATVARGIWRRTVHYQVARPQRGTLEAAVYSARDGSVECLVQAPVLLR
jgi:Immunoglobulin-like domain of bacterial spore germination